MCSRGIDIGTGTKVPLRFVTYLSNVTKIKRCTILRRNQNYKLA
jgi:hypothetical protein